MKNHCGKILEKTSANICRQVPGVKNPADIASRGSAVSNFGDERAKLAERLREVAW